MPHLPNLSFFTSLDKPSMSSYKRGRARKEIWVDMCFLAGIAPLYTVENKLKEKECDSPQLQICRADCLTICEAIHCEANALKVCSRESP